MEKHFRNKLKQHHVAWDKEALWEELVPQLPDNEPKRKRWFLLLLLLFVIPFCWPTEELMPSTEAVEAADPIIQANPDSVHFICTKLQGVGEKAIVSSSMEASDWQGGLVAYVEEEAVSSLVPQDERTLSVEVVTEKTSGLTESSWEKNTEFSFSMAAEEAIQARQNNQATTLLISNGYSLLPSTLEQFPSFILPTRNEDGSTHEGRFFAATFIGVGAVKRNDTYLTGNTELATSQQQNQGFITPKAVTTVQVEAGYRLSSHWSVALGVGQQQIYEQFNFNSVVRSDTLTQDFDKARFFVKSSGDTLFVAGEGDVLEQEVRKIRHHNRLQSIYLPLQVFYTQDYRRFEWTAGVGVNWTATSKYIGRINDAMGVSDDPNYQLTHRWGYSLSLGTRFRLTGNKHLFARFAYQKSPTWQHDGVQQRYTTYGLQMGARVALD